MLLIGLVDGKRLYSKNSYVASTFKFYVISIIFFIFSSSPLRMLVSRIRLCAGTINHSSEVIIQRFLDLSTKRRSATSTTISAPSWLPQCACEYALIYFHITENKSVWAQINLARVLKIYVTFGVYEKPSIFKFYRSPNSSTLLY